MLKRDLRHLDQPSGPQRNDIGDYRTFLKLAPPLRGRRAACSCRGLASGLIDAIVSDHNRKMSKPSGCRSPRRRMARLAWRPCFRRAAARSFRRNSARRLIAAMTIRPAEILRLPQGRLTVARLPISSVSTRMNFCRRSVKASFRCKNTPFDEARMEGRVKLTLVAGRWFTRPNERCWRAAQTLSGTSPFLHHGRYAVYCDRSL